MDQSCHVFTTVDARSEIESSGTLKGVSVESIGDSNQHLESAFSPLASSEGQVFPFSTLPHSAKNGAATALLTMDLGFLTKLLDSGERKLFYRASEVRNTTFFRYYTTHVVLASAKHWEALTESNFEELNFRDEVANGVFRLTAENGALVFAIFDAKS